MLKEELEKYKKLKEYIFKALFLIMFIYVLVSTKIVHYEILDTAYVLHVSDLFYFSLGW